jgi:hypothetical protein
MTERERWIVYPLLFLALGAALRDKLSEHTKTKTIECEELVVYGEDTAGQPPKVLVQIGAMQRTSAKSPHVGQIVVEGLIHAQGIEADTLQANNINAGNYFFHRIPFAPLLRNVPGASPADQMRALQLQQQAAEAAQKAASEQAGESEGIDSPSTSAVPSADVQATPAPEE